MNVPRCAKCRKRLLAMTEPTGHTKLVCLRCDEIDPMKTDAVKWANSSLARQDSARPRNAAHECLRIVAIGPARNRQGRLARRCVDRDR
jgi:phage FluMu protein Com